MRKFNSKIKNFFERRNLSKLTALGLSLALSATIGGHVLGANLSPEADHEEITDTNNNVIINAHASLVDATPVIHVRSDWETMKFTATLDNSPNGGNFHHDLTWSNNGESKIWIVNYGSSNIKASLAYADDTAIFKNVNASFAQTAEENWLNPQPTDNHHITDVQLGTPSDGYVLGAPNAAQAGATPTLNQYYAFRMACKLHVSSEVADTNQATASPARRLIGQYNKDQFYPIGTTTITFASV